MAAMGPISGPAGRSLPPRQSVANSSFAASEVRHGFDTAATDRWRAHLDPLTDRWFRFWCGDQMRQFGYR